MHIYSPVSESSFCICPFPSSSQVYMWISSPSFFLFGLESHPERLKDYSWSTPRDFSLLRWRPYKDTRDQICKASALPTMLFFHSLLSPSCTKTFLDFIFSYIVYTILSPYYFRCLVSFLLHIFSFYSLQQYFACRRYSISRCQTNESINDWINCLYIYLPIFFLGCWKKSFIETLLTSIYTLLQSKHFLICPKIFHVVPTFLNAPMFDSVLDSSFFT